MHYIDGVKFILSKLNGDFNPSLQMLIGVSYDWMNTRMKDSMADSVVSETLRMLEYFSCLLDRLCKSSAADVKSTQQTLMNIISLLNIMAISPTLSEEMAESLAGCLWLLSRLHQSHRQIFPHLKDPLDDVISGQFCHNSVVSCYLATLLADGNNVKLLERRESKIGVTLVRLWFICALNSEDEEWLERTARLLPQISLLSEMGIVADDFKYKRTVAEVACVLFSALNSRVDENRDAELKAFVNSTFEFIPDLVAKLWKLPKAKPLELALSLCGQLVFNCTALIHQQGNSALLLPRILMKVFLSNANYKNDKLTEAQVAALRVSLPLIIQGLCKLNPTDEFVKVRF